MFPVPSALWLCGFARTMTDFRRLIPLPSETVGIARRLGRRNVQTCQQFARAEDPEQLIQAIGGERLEGSGFENEDPDVAFGEAEE